jgi:acetolactate synthase-1/2/3 large subunit
MRNLAEKRAQALKVALEPREVQPPTSRRPSTLVRSLCECLHDLGVRQSFGVSGGAIALLFDALEDSPIDVHHFRHESGAAFAAAEAHFASGRPTVVFATTGPGMLNALTGMTAARWDGAKVILITGATSVAQRGRWATQETSPYTMPQDALYARSTLFDFALRLESPTEFPEMIRRLALGMARPGGFVAHLALPMSMQASRVEQPVDVHQLMSAAQPTMPPDEVARIARLLKSDNFAIWVGFGARHAAPQVRDLMERSGAHVFASPRGKGIIPEGHPQYLGVSGLGGHDTVNDYLLQHRPARLLVLGTRLGEATSFWDRDLLPTEELIHVDIDPDVPGAAYPQARTLAVHAEIGAFLSELVEHFQVRPLHHTARQAAWSEEEIRLSGRGPVRPQVLMNVMQRKVVAGSDAIVLAECGNSFAWCNHYLYFDKPGRYRVSTLFGSMGHAATGVVGAALARGRKKTWAVVGDGSMLMNSEISSAAQYDVPAVWVVLNDSGYGMCRDGQRTLGLSDEGVDYPRVDYPRVDFAAVARSMGADGVRVETEDMLEVAFDAALAAKGPFVIDVTVDSNESSPLLKRFESLIKQGSSKNVPQQMAGWDF